MQNITINKIDINIITINYMYSIMEQDDKSKEFIRKAREVHGDTYDYSKVEYVNSSTNVIIICIKHGEFLQRPTHHINRKQGCKKCSGRCSNTSDFIEKVKEIHEDRYDYSKANYINCKIPIIIICKEHGEFQQTPDGHIKSGCNKCGINNAKLKQTKSIEQFIQQSKNIHGDRYDYSKVEYKNCKSPIMIICKEHGEFQQTPEVHYLGGGCSKCAGRYQPSTEEFIERAREIHGDTYDYSKVSYINSNTKVTIICKTHGEFQQRPQKHLIKRGCDICGGSYKSNTEEFIAKAKEIHGDTYDYSKVEYIDRKTNVIIICKKHGEFPQTPKTHLRNCGCDSCGTDRTSEIRRKPISEFIEESKNIHGEKYDYSKVEYINSNTKVIIICKKHGEFIQTPNSHIRGNGCSKCVNKTEAKLYEKLITIYSSLQTQFKKDWCKKQLCLPYDFCISEYKIIIELDGPQHFQQVANWSSPEEQLENDKYKEECANQNGYSVIRLLQEDVFYDTYDWVKELCHAIEEIKASSEITNVYLSQNGEYEQF